MSRSADDALRESRYRLATAAGGVGVWDLDLDTGEMYIDPQLKMLLGYEDSEIRNHIDDWILKVDPADLERVKAEVDAHVAGATPQYEVEHRMIHKDGSTRWFLARGRLIEDAGRRRLVGTDTDVTARRQAANALREVEGRHRAMLRAVPDLMFVLDKNGVYLHYHAPDPALLRVPPSQFLGRNVREFFPPELADRIIRSIAETIESGEPCTLEYDAPVAGEIRHRETRVVGCDAESALCIVRDVTEQKRAEQAGRQLREGLARAGRVTALGALSATMAHEINQPLASIMANAQAALRMIAAPTFDLAELQDALTDIVNDDRRASEVVRGLRAVLTKEVRRLENLDVQGTLDEIVRLVHDDVGTRGIALQVDLAPDLPPVRGDRIQIQQAALNLLSNAFDAVQDLEPERRRVVLRAAGRNGEVAISVADHGRGVPADEMARVFEPFYSTRPGGMGLGLTICQTIAAAHGGRLTGAANPDGGMTFTLFFPAAIP